MNTRLTSYSLLFTASVSLTAPWAQAQEVQFFPEGTLLATVTDPTDADAVIAIDPLTGDVTILSSNDVGAGAVLGGPESLTLDAAGNLFVVDGAFTDAVISVDTATGNRTTISSDDIGIGENLIAPQSIAIDAAGNIFITDTTLDAVISIDPITGNRTFISSDDVGSGTQLPTPTSLVIDAAGNILVSEVANDAVFSIDPITGDRTIISQNANFIPEIGSGISFSALQSITLDPAGNILVVDDSLDAIVLIDPNTGDRTVLSDDDNDGAVVGTGIGFADPTSIAVDDAGNIFVTDETLDAVISVDPITGNRALLADLEDVFDFTFGGPSSILAVPTGVFVPKPVVPEPSSLALLTAAGVGLLLRRRR